MKIRVVYSDLIKNLKQEQSFPTHSLSGDLLRALSGISGGRKLAFEARSKKVGLWIEPNQISPWE